MNSVEPLDEKVSHRVKNLILARARWDWLGTWILNDASCDHIRLDLPGSR
jgi:hypothetical protein